MVLAAKLSARGVRVRVGNEPFELDGRHHPRGSFLIRREENPAPLVDTLMELAPPLGVEVHSTTTARIERGPDLGGGHWQLLVEPRIAIAAGNPLDYYSVGAAWHLLDRTFGLRVSLIDVTRLRRADLDRYNVLVLPNAWGGASALARALGKSGLEAISAWTSRGGTLVAIGSAALLAADEESELSAVRARSELLEEFPAPRFGLDDDAIRALERFQATGLRPGETVTPAGPYSAESWPEALGIPGPGEPVLGPGTWAMLGKLGERARKRGRLTPAGGNEDDEKAAKDGSPSKEEKKKARERADRRLRRFLPSGAIVSADLDRESYLAYGAGERVAVMVRASDALIARDPVRTVARYSPPDELHLGGLLWPEAAGRIALTAFSTREGKDRGQVILFSDDPSFRGYFWGTRRLFLNAVLLGPGVGTRQTIPW